jgi:hypothetical protein
MGGGTITASDLGQMTTNTSNGLAPNTKKQFPTPSGRRKRFAKIREKIEGKR